MYANVLANIYGSGEDVSINFVFNFDEPTKSAILNAIENGMENKCVEKFVTVITVSIPTSIS